MRIAIRCLLVISASTAPLTGLAQMSPEAVETLSSPIHIVRAEPATSIPLTTRYGKIFVEATLSGKASQFTFDTGSPTILMREFAESIGVTYIGQNTGRDANGTDVVMDIAVVDTLSLGSTTFHDVPVLVSDFETVPLASCVLGNGVIGSEIFAGSAWRIDLDRKELTLGSSSNAVGTSPDAQRTVLHDFGYPHMPIVDYAIGDIQDKALFDTGNSAGVALFKAVLETYDAKASILKDSVQTGRGSEGISAAGLGQTTDLSRFEISSITLGAQTIQDLSGISRTAAPSLIGLGFLGDYVVTLDYVGGAFFFEPRKQPTKMPVATDFSLSVIEGKAIVTQIFDGTQAAKAGLKLGDHVTAVDETLMTEVAGPNRCGLINWVLSDFDPRTVKDLTILRKSRKKTILLSAKP